jgi:ribosomal protein S18 acetylase RimI-like enzyme
VSEQEARSGELARAWRFLARGDMAGTRSEPSGVGTAFYDDEIPLRLDSNYLLVDRPAEAGEVLGEAARLSLRMVIVPDSGVGEQLAPVFAERRWLVRRHVLMAQHREPERTADLGIVNEVSEEDLRAARQRVVEGEPWSKPEIMAQLFAAKHRIAERVTVRYFAVKDGSAVVSYTDLYQDGADAQIEDVGTLPEHRGRGHATAVVLAAIRAAREEGAEFVFLIADREDWPKELYRRLGFDELGYFVKFVAPGT